MRVNKIKITRNNIERGKGIFLYKLSFRHISSRISCLKNATKKETRATKTSGHLQNSDMPLVSEG
jgi:hypothetical protein